MSANVGSINLEIKVTDKGSVNIRKIGRESEAAGNKSGKSFRLATKSIGEFNAHVADGVKTIASMAAKITALAGAATAGAFAYIAKESVDAAISMQRLNVAMVTATGSQKDAAEATRFLASEADRLGLVYETQIRGYSQIAAAGKAWNLTASETQEIYLGVAEAGAAMQLSQDDLNGVFRAFTQIMSKGKLQAEEIRGQIGERIPGAFAIAAKSIGVTTAELSDMLDRGEVMSQDFIPKFSKQLREDFAGSLENATRTTQAEMNRLNNAMLQAKVIIGEALLPYVNQIITTFTGWAKQTTGNRDALQDMVKSGILYLIDGIGATVEVIRFFHNSWNALKLAGTGALYSIATMIETVYEGVRMLLAPFDLLYDGLVKIGAAESNPFDKLSESLGDFRSNALGAFEDVIGQTEKSNEKYDEAHEMIEEYRKSIEETPKTVAEATNKIVKSIEKEEEAREDLADLNEKLRKEEIKAAEKLARDRERTVDRMYRNLKFEASDYRKYKERQLLAEYDDMVRTTGRTVLAYENYVNKMKQLDKEEADHKEKLAEENSSSLSSIWGNYFSDNKDNVQSLTTSWVRGENLKESATGMAKDKIIGHAGRLAGGYFDKLIGLLGEQIGAWITLGASQSSTEGDDWKGRLLSAAGYLAGIGISLAAAKEINNYATGGWIGAHSAGGVISQGSGVRDDVFLGFTDGGSTANWGMGGEFVVNRNATARHLGLLRAINNDRFADGGPISDPRVIANKVNAAGFATFLQTWADEGNWKTAIKNAILYYAGSFGASLLGKAMGPELFFAEGGVVRNRGFSLGSFIDDLKGGSPLPGVAPTPGQLKDDPSLLFNNKLTRAYDKISKYMPKIKGIGDVGKWLWEQDWGGALGATIDSVDAALIPFYEDILTPGSVNFDSHPERQIEAILNSFISDRVLKPFSQGGLLKSYDVGGFIDRTGPIYAHRGEEVLTARESRKKRGGNWELHFHFDGPIMTDRQSMKKFAKGVYGEIKQLEAYGN